MSDYGYLIQKDNYGKSSNVDKYKKIVEDMQNEPKANAFTAEDAARRLAVNQQRQVENQQMQNSYVAKEMEKVQKGAELVKGAENIMNNQQQRLLKGTTNLTDYASKLPQTKVEQLKAESEILNPEKYHKDVDAGYYGRKAAEGLMRAGEGISDASTMAVEHMKYPFLKGAETITSLGGLVKNPISNVYSNMIEKNKEKSLKAMQETPVDNYSRMTDFIYNNASKGHKLAGEVVSAATGMLPTVAANILAPGAGYAMLAGQGYGSGTQQAYQHTGELGAKEEIYGLLSGLAEVAVEKLSGGIGGLGNGMVDDIASKLIKNGFIRSATGEGIEEAVTAIIDPYLQRLTYNEDAESAKAADVIRSAIVGSLTSMLLQGGSAAVNSVNTSLNTDKSVKKLNKIDNKTLDQLEEINKNLGKGNTFSEVANLPEMDKATQKQLKGLENLIPQKNGASESHTNELQTPMQQTNQTEDKTVQSGNIEQITKNEVKSDNFVKGLEKFKAKDYTQTDDMVVLDETPQYLYNLGFDSDKPLVLNMSKLETIMKEPKGTFNGANQHGITMDIVEQLPNALQNPLNVIKNPKYSKRVVVVTELTDQYGDIVIVPIEMNTDGYIENIENDVNRINTVYGKENYDIAKPGNDKSYIEYNEDKIIYDIDEDITKKRDIDSDYRLQLPSTTINTSNNIVNQNDNSVNTQYAQDKQNDTAETQSAFSMPSIKEQQLKIIQENNPMNDDYHVGIRTVDDIKTFDEVIDDDESFVWGDFSREDAQKALEAGEITVYSSSEIKNGNFVSTSYNQAKDYAGSGKVYSKTVPIEDVAWINGDEGQYAKVENSNKSSFSMPKNEVQSFASSEASRPYMDLDRYTSRDSKSKANQTRLTDIQNAINDIVTVKTGKFRQNAYGIYKTHGEIIRLKQMKDIPVALHELTHHLDKKYNLSSSDKISNELEKIAVVGKNATKQTAIKEGVAEFGRYYMTDKEYAKEIAPFYYDAFEKALNNDPEMKAKVENIRQMVTNYLDQSPMNRLSSNIDYGDEQMSLWGKAKEGLIKTAHNFRKNFVDDLDPLKKIVNEIAGDNKLMTEQDAYKLLRLNNGVTGKVQVALEYGVVDKNGEKIGKSLKEILKPVASEQKEFTAYLTALRAKDLRNRGVESGLLSRDVDDVIKAYSKNETFNEAAKELYNFQNQILETTLVDSGIITKDAMKAYNKNNPHYVPFYRVMDENFKQSKDSKSKKPSKIKGSTRDIINPLESIIKNTYSYMQMAERNDTYKTLFDMANRYDGTGKWFDKVPTDMTGTTVTAEDVKSILEQLNLGEEDVNYNEIFTTLFKPANNQKGNIVTVMEKGKPVHYEINDKELYDILSPAIKGDNFIVKMLAPASKALRVGATHTPEFVLRNPIRDTQEAGIYSKNGFIPVVDTMIGIFNVAGRSDLYYKWLQSGGSGSTYTNAQRPVLQKTLKGLTEGVTNEKITKKALKGVGDLVKHPLRTYLDVAGAISNVAEEGTRVGEFRRALKQGKTEKEAALDSREITLDFSRGGKNAKDINKVVAFFNAEVQGLDKVVTSFKDRPVATFLKALAYTTLPAILLRGLQDEEKLEEVPQWEKDEFFIVFFGDTPIKIPKGQGLGQIFGTIPERAIDFLRTHDRDAFDGLMQRLVTSYVPIDSTTSIFPNFFLPLIENSANYSFFRQQPIVSKSLENRSPRYQYDESTSTVAKTIGNLTNVSPKKIDNLISGYTGNLGKDITNLAGIPIEWLSGEKKKEYKSTNAKLKQIPLLKGFIAGNTASKELDKFYENKAKASTDYTDAKFKYSDGNKTKAEEKELNYYKEINSLYNSAYNDIKKIDEQMDEVRKGPGTNEYKENKLKKLKSEKEKIANDVEGKVKNKQLKAMNVKFNK